MFQLLAYLRFWLRSGNAHGLHSPFVFGVYTSVVRHTGIFDAYAPIESRRQELLNSSTSITVTDFGAGSHTGAGQQRRIADIARTAAKPPHLAQLLFRLANYFRPATILELGTSLGLTTAYLAAADSRSKVVTLEGCANVANVARETFAALQLENIRIVEGNMDNTLAPALAALGTPVDFAFFDGNHRYEPTLSYFEHCLAYRTDESVFVFDDIHWSEEMERAWEVIKAHPDVTVTVDLFHIGLVFFRKGQPKQHFWLRT
ncbi:class I SAM-dependent methyltransferase [Hymenobacter sp. BT683]|uniref:Class I SAM-dependent methyltransferase n=1 Tax=Hymenobacter jeongseonensis TaxID=2791027 RepID=A0ABS0IIF2_9BACT|nr:class I SAM-dependent methyltransferase [Hymenobacter jeongseonensis]MBF9238142.1 class I SAM-dependent methyltransferase [Hymenobacter jeongseonensis]